MRKVQVLSHNEETVAHHTLYRPSRVSEAYQPVATTRGRNKPLKAILTLVSLAMFMSAATAFMVVHTWNFYDRTSIAGWTSYTVQAGDTVSSLAAKFDPVDYQATVIREIEKHNGLVSANLQIGQVLQMPVVRRDLP